MTDRQTDHVKKKCVAIVMNRLQQSKAFCFTWRYMALNGVLCTQITLVWHVEFRKVGFSLHVCLPFLLTVLSTEWPKVALVAILIWHALAYCCMQTIL